MTGAAGSPPWCQLLGMNLLRRSGNGVVGCGLRTVRVKTLDGSSLYALIFRRVIILRRETEIGKSDVQPNADFF